MAEESAATPQSEEVAPAPVADEASAIAAISGMLEAEGTPEEAPEPEAPETEDAEATPKEGDPETESKGKSQVEAKSEEAEEEAEEEEAKSSEEESEGEESEGEDQELPTTLKELADAYEVDPTELAGTLQIPINDEGETVTLAEAIRGHLRERDYIRKTEGLADDRKKFASGIKQVHDLWGQKLSQTDNLIAALSDQINLGPSDEEIDGLYAVDAEEGARAQRARDKQVSALQQAVQQREQNAELQEQEQQRQAMERRQHNQQLLSGMIPEMSDDKFRQEFEATIYQGLPEHYGFNEEEVSAFMGGEFDARYIPVIRDALAFQGLQAGNKKMTKELKAKPKVTKPGRGVRPKQKGDFRSDTQKSLRQTGSKDDALDFIKSFLE